MSGIFPWGVDARLVSSTLAGNKDAFGRLVERHLPAVEAIALAYTRNRADAEDVSQEVFLKAYHSLNTLRERAKFGSWIATIARNTGLRMASRGSREQPLTDARATSLSEPAPDHETNELLQILHTHVLDLPEEMREVLLLHYYAGQSLREVAATLNISREAAAKRLQRGRDALAREIVTKLEGATMTRTGSEKRASKIAMIVMAAPVAWKAGAASGAAGVLGELSLAKIAAMVSIAAAAGGAVYFGLRSSQEVKPPVTVATKQEEVNPRQEPKPSRVSASSRPALAVAKLETTGIGTIGVNANEPDGRPAAGVRIRIEHITWQHFGYPPDETFAKETTTDGSGVAQFDELPLGTYGIVCESSNALWADYVVLSEEAPAARTSMALQPGVPLEGSVVDGNGQPVPNAVVYVYDIPLIGGIAWEILAAGRVKADEGGRFSGRLVLPVPLRFCVAASGHAKTISDLVQPGSAPIRLVVQDGVTMTGRVVEADTQTPLPEIALTISGGPAGEYVTVDSDAAGEFAIDNLLPGSYLITVEESGYTTEAPIRAQAAPGADDSSVIVPVRLGGTIAGRVFDGNTGEPIEGAKVSASSIVNGHPVRRSSELSDATGAYAIFGLASANYRVSAHIEDSAYVSKGDARAVSVEVGQEVENIDIPLVRGALVRGRVVEQDGTGTTFAIIHITRPDGSQMTSSRTENEDGRFELHFLDEEPLVQIRALGQSGSSEAVSVRPRVNDVTEITVPLTIPRTASIEGTVVDRNGRPIPHSHVYVVMASDNSVTPATGRELICDEDGRFQASGLHSDLYYVGGPEVRHGLQQGKVPIDLTNGGAARDIVVRMQTSGGFTIAGQVIDEAGHPIAGVTLQASDWGGVANSGPDGTFRIANIGEGTHTLYLTHQNYATLRIPEIAGGSEGVVAHMQRKGSLAGTVVDAATGQPIAEFEVLHTDGRLMQHEDGRMDIQNRGLSGKWFRPYGSADGRFTLSNTESGDTVLAVRARGYVPFVQELTLTPGGTAPDMTIRLEPAARVVVTVIDENNAPVRGAYIETKSLTSWLDFSAGNTDEQGQVVVDNQPATTVQIRAHEENRQSELVEVLPSKGAGTSVTLRVVPQRVE